MQTRIICCLDTTSVSDWIVIGGSSQELYVFVFLYSLQVQLDTYNKWGDKFSSVNVHVEVSSLLKIL